MSPLCSRAGTRPQDLLPTRIRRCWTPEGTRSSGDGLMRLVLGPSCSTDRLIRDQPAETSRFRRLSANQDVRGRRLVSSVCSTSPVSVRTSSRNRCPEGSWRWRRAGTGRRCCPFLGLSGLSLVSGRWRHPGTTAEAPGAAPTPPRLHLRTNQMETSPRLLISSSPRLLFSPSPRLLVSLCPRLPVSPSPRLLVSLSAPPKSFFGRLVFVFAVRC